MGQKAGLHGTSNQLATLQVKMDSWFVRNVDKLKTLMRLIFGVVWGIDAAFKLQPGFVASFSDIITGAKYGQPDWLQGWFSFWASTTLANPAFFVYSIAFLEAALAFCLITGFLRKLAYTGGFFLSLIIWSVPEGFGGPYGPSSTDIGTGIIYSFVFIFLLIINATFGPSKYSLDYWIERKWPAWKRIAEIRSGS